MPLEVLDAQQGVVRLVPHLQAHGLLERRGPDPPTTDFRIIVIMIVTQCINI